MLSLVLGGDRSGKSSWAEQLALRSESDPLRRYYLATGEAFDEEMKARIALHRQRRGEQFVTIEEPVHLGRVLVETLAPAQVILVECLTTWLGNLSYRAESATNASDGDSYEEVEELLRVLATPRAAHVILVSSELGLGLVPADAASREFRDRSGRLNERVAALADNVYLVVAGLPLVLKGQLL